MAVYFSIFLVIVTVITGAVWLADKYYLAPQRKLKLTEANAQCEGELPTDVADGILEPNGFVDTSVQVFPVIAFVLVLRSFLWEPFQIPSGSMMPTLLDGDFILVNKHNYGLKDPVFRNKFMDVGEPERGDIVVFKYPLNENIDYIKRLVGLPGDRVIYRDKTLYIKPACNDTNQTECKEFKQFTTEFVNSGQYKDGAYDMTRYTNTIGDTTFDILVNDAVSAREQARAFCAFAEGNLCEQSGTAQDEFVVPEGHYFLIGDNRDNSLDGRFWGFVPEHNIVGEAEAIWMSFDFERTEEDFLPTWVPTGIRFSRIGGID